MTNGVACPEPVLLSQFFDHELAAPEESRIAQHLRQCSICQAQIERLLHSDQLARAQVPMLRPSLSALTPSASCPSLEKVTAYMQGSLTAKEELRIEQHLQGCAACFQQAKEAARVLTFLASPQMPPAPASLKTQVATQWEAFVSIPRLVIQMTAQGLRLIESYLTPPLLNVQEVLTPLSAFRRGERSSALTLRLQAGEAEIDVLAIPENDGVAMRLTLFDSEHAALADRRVFIRRQGRAIFSAQTDERGELHVPRLDPGEYEVSCHEIHTTFQFELRL
jgi:anti-sigma factor RsiW